MHGSFKIWYKTNESDFSSVEKVGFTAIKVNMVTLHRDDDHPVLPIKDYIKKLCSAILLDEKMGAYGLNSKSLFKQTNAT